ncbi:MAG: TIGR04211 family SH3 domain-containing protein [Halieaceae bacterium]|nr:TIGR04211 family SH3 domain-containing protein [Halieaceae bacterium]
MTAPGSAATATLKLGAAALLLVVALSPVRAQDTVRYVSDEVFIALHAGPGSNYRWLGRLIPGTELTEKRRSTDGNWAEVETERGTVGWVQAEYLASEPPAQVRLPSVVRQLEDAEREAAELRDELSESKAQRSALSEELSAAQARLQELTEELAQLRQVSGSAIETAENNRRLVEEVAGMRTELDTLEADNLRLQERASNSAFMDGALAVLLGVIITLVVPRLWPRRKRSSSWA